MKPLLLCFDPLLHPSLTAAAKSQFEVGTISCHTFPDEETLLTLSSNCQDRPVIIWQSLSAPNTKALPLLFAAETARRLGASRIGLCSPYLAYMRQDTDFHDGECISARVFADFLSNHFDFLVTVDPHLHRISHLSEIFSIPNRALHAPEVISQWISANVTSPLLVGPDGESRQWVEATAELIDAPYVVFEKKRLSDKHVELTAPDFAGYQDRNPVLLDDIASSGTTLLTCLEKINQLHHGLPYCIVVHALLNQTAYDLIQSKCKSFVSTNTILHPSNQIDLYPLLNQALLELMG